MTQIKAKNIYNKIFKQSGILQYYYSKIYVIIDYIWVTFNIITYFLSVSLRQWPCALLCIPSI